RDMRPCCIHIHRIQGLTCRHEKAIALCSAKTNICARFRQPDHSDALAIRSDNLNARASSCPDVAVHIASNAVGGRRRSRTRDVDLNKPLSIADRLAVRVEDFDLAGGAGICDVNLLVVWRKADSVWATEFIAQLVDLESLAIDAVNGHRQF